MSKCYVHPKSGKAYFPLFLSKPSAPSSALLVVMGERNGYWYGPIRVIDPRNFLVEDRPRPVHKGASK